MRRSLFPVTHCCAPLTFPLLGSVLQLALLPVAHLGTSSRHSLRFKREPNLNSVCLGRRFAVPIATTRQQCGPPRDHHLGGGRPGCVRRVAAQRGSALARSDSSCPLRPVQRIQATGLKTDRPCPSGHPFIGRYRTYLTAIHPPDWLMNKPNCLTQFAHGSDRKRALAATHENYPSPGQRRRNAAR
jgi:hypothetical protein